VIVIGFSQFQMQFHHEKFFCTEYEKSKVATDKIALQAASEGVPIVLLYPGVIYGPGKVTGGNLVAKMVLFSFFLLLLCFVNLELDLVKLHVLQL
jgi:farnesol dehydrogenase